MRGLGHWVRSMAALAFVVSAAGCAIVPQNRRQHLADPTMQLTEDPLGAKAKHKLHTTREGASGGNGEPAGACGN